MAACGSMTVPGTCSPISCLARRFAPRRPGIWAFSSASHLFGGVVPFGFVATKAITHGLIAPEAAAPTGWSPAFPEQVRPVVLGGFSAFSVADGMAAGARLLERQPLRFKPTHASGGRGQAVITTPAQLADRLAAMAEGEIGGHGVVLEENLAEVRTYSVGVVEVGGLTTSYYGTQRMTRDNRGEAAYGGSSLVFARGGFEDLLAQELPDPIRTAIHQARHYDRAAHACFPGLFASRRNYDIAQGRDGQGRWRSGVLEQSWRVGGASGAEVAALQHLQAFPQISSLRAASVELYGACEPPPGAIVYFQGDDAEVGPITKYAVVENDGHASA